MVGYQVARTLAADGQDIVLIDPDGDVVRDAVNRLDCMAVQGRANNLADVLKAGIQDADYFIALTGSDEINIIACALVGAEFKNARTIARVRSLDYGQGRLYQTLESGIDYLINPDTETAVNVLTALAYGAISDIFTFEGMDIQIRNHVLGQGSRLNGKKIMDLAKEIGRKFLMPLIHRGDKYLIPTGETEVRDGDTLYLAADMKDFDHIFEVLGKSQRTLKSVLLVGGTRITEAIAGYLCGQTRLYGVGGLEVAGINRLYGKRKVRIVEEDYDRCKELADKFPHALIVHGDISDEALFDEEQLADCDVVVALSENEERNIIAGLYAKRRGVRRAVSLVYSGNYLSIARHLDIDVAISLKNSVANTIQSIIREDKVESVQAIGDGTIEIIEFVLDEGSRVIGKPLMQVPFPSETLVLALQRGKESSIARGNTELAPQDRVLVLTRKEHAHLVQNLFGSSADAKARTLAGIVVPS